MRLDKIGELAVILLADRSLQRKRLESDAHDLVDAVYRHFECAGDLFDRWVAQELLAQATGGFDELVNDLGDGDGDSDGAALIDNGAGDRAADPPGCIGAE